MKNDELEKAKNIAKAFGMVFLIIPISIFNIWYLYTNVIMVLSINMPILSYFHVAGIVLFIKVLRLPEKSNDTSDSKDFLIKAKSIFATQIIFCLLSLIFVWLM
jgi:hypothetical protein